MTRRRGRPRPKGFPKTIETSSDEEPKRTKTSEAQAALMSEVSKRGWREGVGDEQTPKKEPKSSPEMCRHSPKRA